jgi:hypothetical protein
MLIISAIFPPLFLDNTYSQSPVYLPCYRRQLPEVNAMDTVVDALVRGLCQVACAGSRTALSACLDLMTEKVEGCKVRQTKLCNARVRPDVCVVC